MSATQNGGHSSRPLSGGAEIQVRRHAVAPSVAIRVWLRGGLLVEPSPGLGLACGRLLTEGTSERSWEQIALQAEDLGIDISGFGGAECTGVRTDALAADWRQALELTAEVVLDASFPADRCDWMRQQMVGELASLGDQPDVLMGWAFLHQLYGEHPLGRPIHGSPDGLRLADSPACRRFHQLALGRGAIVSIVGDVDEAAALASATELFRRTDAAPVEDGMDDAEPRRPRPEDHPDLKQVTLPPGDQAQILVGHLTVPVTDPDYVALELASIVLGAGPGLVGRIPSRLREREGLAYSASASIAAGAGSLPGRLAVHAGVAPEAVDEALRCVHEELADFVSEGVTDLEFERAREYLLGSDPFRRETAGQLAALQAQSMFFDRPFDDATWLVSALRELDVASLNDAIGRHLDADALQVTIGIPRLRNAPVASA